MKKIVFSMLLALLCSTVILSCEREGVLEEVAETPDLNEREKLCPVPTFSFSPCDHSFRVFAHFNGQPLVGWNYSYTITKVSTNQQVDNGTISHGNYTTPVLQYCTLYRISLYDPCGGTYHVHYVYSDGCNNTFLC